MKAALLHGPRDLRLQDYPDPVPGTDDVLVRISRNGLCGSDIHFYEDGKLGPFQVTSPYIPGHEASGTVECGAASGLGPQAGVRVAIEPGIPCRRCALCKSGRYNLCPDVVFMSAPPVNGTFAQLVALPWDFAHPLPDSVDDERGAMVEPLSVAVQACRRGNLHAGDVVAVLGAGPIGLATCLVARAFGAAATIAIDVLPSRLDLAARVGVTHTHVVGDSPAAPAVLSLTNGRGADVVVDASGSSQACSEAPELAKRGGSVVLVGWPDTPRLTYPIEVVLERELDVHGVNRYCNTFPAAIGLLEAGLVDPAPLISHRFTFDRVVEAVEFASRNPAETMKIIIGG